MAAPSANVDKPSYGLVIVGIIYAIITVIAIYIGVEYDVESAFKIHLFCAGAATIAMLFGLPKGKDYTQVRKRASYIYTHLILWGGIIFFPFGDSPLISLGALLLIGISEAGYVAALTKDEDTKRSNDSKSSVAGISGRLAIALLAIIVVITILEKTGYDTKIKSFYAGFVSGLELNKRNPNQGASENENISETTPTSTKLTASFLEWRNPIVIQMTRAFTTSATGTIDFNDDSDNAASLRINLPKSGNILLLDGTVSEANNNGGKIVGNWKQEKTNASGNYILTMQNGKVRLVLKNNGANVGIVELN
jgi:hypothetical protein